MRRVMKKIALLMGLAVLTGFKVFAQAVPVHILEPIEPVRTVVYEQQPAFSNLPPTHIQTSNESFQNNSQFMNKDNFIDPSKIYTTSNGTYWTPGYSNPANRNYNTEGLAPNTS